MNHAELLAGLDDIVKTMQENKLSLTSKYISALCAVVELATTYQYDSYVNEEFDQGLQTAFRLVIQAIEKELS